MCVNRIGDERPEYTTTRLALASTDLGHETYYVDLESFTRAANKLWVHAKRVPRECGSLEAVLEALEQVEQERIEVSDLDALMLRAETEKEVDDRPWAQSLEITFGLAARDAGVCVVNDPIGLTKAWSKLYLEDFPPDVRPDTLITRNEDEIKEFIDAHNGSAVVKPLKGARGENVFFVRPDDDANVNQMIEAVLRDGYAIAQEYLTEATDGDVRMLMLDGAPLQVDGTYAAFRRIPPAEDLRANMSAGGGAEAVAVDDPLLSLAEKVGPKLRDDGMFLVGIDIVGDKIIEINVESPGGLGSAGTLGEVDFATAVIEALAERST